VRLRFTLRFIAVLAFAAGLLAPLAAQNYDLVIANGRVIDPESGLDGVRHIAVTAGKIVTISETPLSGQQQIDAKGLVVAPGFIDLHSHGQTDETYRCQALDGVTTAFELEVGTGDIDRW
jgi:N-acyl-D-aspartate/D-glutamate deacylase